MSSRILKPAAEVCSELGRGRRTLDRWVKDRKLNFPQPVIIRGRWYFDGELIDAWKAERLREAIDAAA